MKKHIKLFKSLIIVTPVLALVSPLIILSNTGCGNPEPEKAYSPDGSDWKGHISGTISFTTNSVDHTYIITGNSYYRANNTFTIPHYVLIGGINYTVTSIANEAFARNYLISAVNFNKVTSIGHDAFAECGTLYKVDFGDVTTIGNRAFFSCKALEEINLRGVTSIGFNAFCFCYLTKININGDNSVFVWTGSNENNGYIHRKSDGDASVTPSCVSDGISSGGIACGFVQDPMLQSISDYAFYGCSGMIKFSASTLNSIGNYAFSTCERLADIYLGLLASMGTDAFVNCPITTCDISQYCTDYTIEGTTQDGFIKKADDAATINPTCGTTSGIGWGNITFSSPITTIAANAFADNKGITSINFGTVTTIGNHAFESCEGVLWMDLTNATSLGNDWNYGCKDLNSIIIGSQQYSTTDYGWDNVGQSACILYAPSSEIGETFKSNIIRSAYSEKWTVVEL